MEESFKLWILISYAGLGLFFGIRAFIKENLNTSGLLVETLLWPLFLGEELWIKWREKYAISNRR